MVRYSTAFLFYCTKKFCGSQKHSVEVTVPQISERNNIDNLMLFMRWHRVLTKIMCYSFCFLYYCGSGFSKLVISSRAGLRCMVFCGITPWREIDFASRSLPRRLGTTKIKIGPRDVEILIRSMRFTPKGFDKMAKPIFFDFRSKVSPECSQDAPRVISE